VTTKLGMELVACHPSGFRNFELANTVLGNFCTPVVMKDCLQFEDSMHRPFSPLNRAALLVGMSNSCTVMKKITFP
jgi:hypothetical protein